MWEINIRYPLNRFINNLKILIHRNALFVNLKLLPICEQIHSGYFLVRLVLCE